MTRWMIGAALLLVGAAPAPEAPSWDVVIRGGRVLDGAGNPWLRADVAIRDGRIARIGTVEGRGREEIDARGRYVAPGFVDALDHSQRALLNDGSAASKLRMGVTTLMAGEGGTAVPAAELAGYFTKLEQQGIAVNFGTTYGAVQARVKVMGDAAGAPTEAQLQAMEAEVRTAMAAGAFGVSSALIYSPATFQSTADLTRLATIAGRCGGMYATHMRDESDKLLTAIDEAVAIAERSGARLEIYHIKAAYAPLWGKLMSQALARIEAARRRGVDVAANIYPYTAGGTGLDVTVPTHMFANGREAAQAALRDPAVRARLKAELKRGPQADWSNFVHASGGWKNVVLASAHNAKYSRFEGQSLAAIGKALGQDPADAAWDIWLGALPKRATALYYLMDERDVTLAMRRPWVSVGTDASVTDRTVAPETLGKGHPRAHGTFPRIIAEYVNRRGVLTLEDAVRKMTSLPAGRMGLTDRGLVREGLRADLVVFDAAKVRDRATYADPTAAPEGIGEVLVNGVVALRASEPTGSRSGTVLRHRCTIPPPAQPS
jgi:N-acyl-D-amino-acid deacylase